MEIDIIALCCEFAEGEIEDVLKDYGLKNMDELTDRTIVIEVDQHTIIYQIF